MQCQKRFPLSTVGTNLCARSKERDAAIGERILSPTLGKQHRCARVL